MDIYAEVTNRIIDQLESGIIYNKEGILELKLSEENEIVPAEIVLHDSDFGQSLGGNDYRMYYISDIHLNHRLQNKFPEHATKQEVVWYVKSIAEKMIMSAPSRNEEDYLLIAGDVSYDFEIAKIFYSRLIELWNPKKIVVVLGNHELWDWNAPQEQKTESKLAKVISKYRRLSSQLGIRFLHNELLLISEGKERTLSEKRIHDLSVEKINHHTDTPFLRICAVEICLCRKGFFFPFLYYIISKFLLFFKVTSE